MADNEREYVDSLSEAGSKLKGSCQFIKGQVDRIKTDARKRKLGPNRADFEALLYIVKVQADVIEELGNTMQNYDLWLSEQGIPHHYLTIAKRN